MIDTEKIFQINVKWLDLKTVYNDNLDPEEPKQRAVLSTLQREASRHMRMVEAPNRVSLFVTEGEIRQLKAEGSLDFEILELHGGL